MDIERMDVVSWVHDATLQTYLTLFLNIWQASNFVVCTKLVISFSIGSDNTMGKKKYTKLEMRNDFTPYVTKNEV